MKQFTCVDATLYGVGALGNLDNLVGQVVVRKGRRHSEVGNRIAFEVSAVEESIGNPILGVVPGSEVQLAGDTEVNDFYNSDYCRFPTGQEYVFYLNQKTV